MAWSELNRKLDRPREIDGIKLASSEKLVDALFWLTPDEDRGSLPPVAHPHVVVQDDVFNRSRLTTVVRCALTTNQRRATEPGNVLLDSGEGNLPQPSVVIVSQVSSVERRARIIVGCSYRLQRSKSR